MIEVSGKIELYQTGRKWNATDGIDTEVGNSPKAVIAALFAKKPELAEQEIVYSLTKSNDVIQDANVCPTCGKNVTYIKGRKSNGRIGVMVLHEGEEMPASASVVPEGGITREYMLWLLERAHEIPVVTVKKVVEETALVTIGSEVSNVDKPEIPIDQKKVTTKEKIKVVLKKEVAVARDLPSVDISDSKRNRFVIVGRVVSAMKSFGVNDEEIMDARQNMLQKETGFVQFVENVSRYANLYDIN